MKKAKTNIVRFAVITRIFTILLALMTNVLEDYDRSAPESKFKRWDAIYFLNIAENGYQHEQQHAFFPGYPLLIRIMATLTGSVNQSSLIYTGMILSNVSFIVAALVLYTLGKELGFRPRTCYNAAIVFCISPCSIFLSSVYTESFFALLSFMGMLAYVRGNRLQACAWFTVSASVRSNGCVYAGFFIWDLIKCNRKLLSIMLNLIFAAIVLVPFIGFQAFGYIQFCTKIPSRLWCSERVPILYSFVQKHYWNNGFLNYWTANQIPLFVLGFPLFFLNFMMLKEYFQFDVTRIMTLGMIKTKNEDGDKAEFDNSKLLPFVYLTTFLLAYLLFFMHVQVILRFFTCLPLGCFYIGSKLNTKGRTNWIYYIYYCVIWNLVGTILFATFLPPA